MSDNTLKDRGDRVGFIFDGDEATPHVAAHLEADSARITLVLPWLEDHNPGHRRWFSDGIHWGDDPKRTKYRYKPPEAIDFLDADGQVALVGCRSGASKTILTAGVGRGIVEVDFAVLGANDAARWGRINGLRSEVDGLGAWMGLRSLSAAVSRDARGRVESIQLELKSPEPVHVSNSLNTEVRPSFGYGQGTEPDVTEIRERMYIQTRVKDPRDWSIHLQNHFAVRDLVRLSAWRALQFRGHEALRNDDPVRSLAGPTRLEQWLAVETRRTGVGDPAAKWQGRDFLFRFDDLGPAGVKHWIDLRATTRKAIDPILYVLSIGDAAAEVKLAQMGIGLEALAFKVAIEAGLTPRQAANERYLERMQRIVADLSVALPFDGPTWCQEMRDCYIAVKHADQASPDFVRVAAAHFGAVQVFRSWVAGRIGVPKERLAAALKDDRITTAYKAYANAVGIAPQAAQGGNP